MKYSYRLFIDGQDVDGVGWTYTVRASSIIADSRTALTLKRQLELGRIEVDAADDTVVGRVARSDASLEAAAVDAAARAARGYRLMPAETRFAMVAEFNKALRDRATEFIDILVAEGHPRRLAQWEISGQIRSTDPDSLDWYRTQLSQEYFPDGRRIQLVRKPDGVVAVQPPANASGSNATMAVLCLLVGNALVVRAPRTGPLSTMFIYRELLAPILAKYGAPDGVLNLVSGPSQRIIDGWLDHPGVDTILFFGDSDVGLGIGERCVARGKKSVLELAGNDGVLVWHDADLEYAADALVECFYGSSQICMVPKYCLVHPKVADAFVAAMVERTSRIRPGFPEDGGVLSPVLKGHLYMDYLAEARSAGAEVLTGGRRVDVHGAPDAEGIFCEPALVRVNGLAVADKLSCVREETFFPLLPLVVIDDAADEQRLLDEVVEFFNANKYGLRNSVWTGDPDTARYLIDRLDNGGQLKVNASHIEFAPILSTHGGTGHTGGPYGELNYAGLRTTRLQGVLWGDGRAPQALAPEVLAAEGITPGAAK